MAAFTEKENLLKENLSSLQYRIARLNHSLDLNNARQCSLIRDGKIILVHQKDDSLRLISTQNISPPLTGDSSIESELVNNECLKFDSCSCNVNNNLVYGVDKEKNISIFSANQTLTQMADLQFNSWTDNLTEKGIKEIESVKIIHVVNNTSLYLIHKQYFISLVIDERNYKLTEIKILPTTLDLDQPAIDSYKIIGDTLVLLQIHLKHITAVNIKINTVVWKIDLSKTEINLTNQTTWTVSQDMDYIILINGNKLHKLCLKHYVTAHPERLLDDHLGVTVDRESHFQNMRTCQTGDIVWNETLSNFNIASSKRSQPWYKRLFEKSSKTDVKISGFNKSKIIKTEGNAVKFDEIFIFTEEFKNTKIKDIVFGCDVVSLSCADDDNSQRICVVDLVKKIFFIQSLGENHIVLLSESKSGVHVVLSSVYLMYILTNHQPSQPDLLISKMMLYGCATSADYLCHLNKWERGSIPLPALEDGLKHRQLDTVAFFLKSKENIFSMARNQPPISPLLNPDDSLLWKQTFDHHNNMKNLEPALFLLVETVKDCSVDNQSKHFAHNLLTLTLNYLYSLLHDGLDVSRSLGSSEATTKERENLDSALDLLMTLIAELRCCLKLVDVKVTRKQSSIMSDTLDGNENISDIKWDRTTEEAVEMAVNANELPDLQHHLLVKGKQSDYNEMIMIGVNSALNHLRSQNVKQARSVLSKLGFDYTEKLWDVVLYLNDFKLQRFILHQLVESDDITDSQRDLIEFISTLNLHYPQHSFKQAFFIKTTASQYSHWNESVLSTRNSANDLSAVCGDINSNADRGDNYDDGPYSEYLVDWVQYWDDETKERIMLDTKIKKSDFVMEEYSNHKLLWKYILSHNLYTESLVLLEIIIKQLEVISSAKKQNIITWLWSGLKYCGSYLKTLITIQLLRHSLYSEDLEEDLNLIMTELIKVGGVIQQPHPLSNCHNVDLFHLNFINYCVNHQLVQPLWSYCLLHRLEPDKMDIENSEMIKWFHFFSKMFMISKKQSCPEGIFEASFSSSNFIWTSDLGVADMIVQGHTLAAIATLPFCPTPLHQVVSDGGLLSDVDKDILDSALKPFPKLHSALIPSCQDSKHSDINLYQLLKDNAPFDVSRLFGWQTSNTVAGEDSRTMLPYFSQPELVSQFAHTEKLRFTYYLKQGRPCYAFLSFLAEELAPGTSTLSSKRIQTACGISLWIAVKNFTLSHIASSCVAFVDMLGQDSSLTRTFLQVAATILQYKNTGLVANTEKHKILIKNNEEEIVSLLQASIRSRRRYSPKVLILLEEAICNDIKDNNIVKWSFEAAEKWILAIIFCNLQKLPLTTKYLECCARSDEWLSFVWFAQYHQFPRQQLQGLLHHFRSRHLRDHLHYVIENADAKSVVTSAVNQGTDNSEKPGGIKDVRSSLYSKIGVTTNKDSDEWSSEEEDEIQLPPSLESLVNQEKEVPTVTFKSAADDVFGVVFDAQNTPSPWKSLLTHAVILNNALFAELAFCENDSALLPCLCGWLVAMMESSDCEKFLRNHGISVYKWTMTELEALIDIYLQQRWEFTLATAFDIFTPNIALLPFLKFSAEFILRNNHEMCRNYLGDFKEAMFNLSQTKVKEEVKLSLLEDKEWTEKTVYKILLYYLTSQRHTYTLLHFLELLDHENIALVFSFDVCDFSKLHKLSEILHSNRLQVDDFSDLLSSTNPKYLPTCQSIINLLIGKKSFQDARRFAALTKLNGDYITIAQLEYDKDSLISSDIWISKVARIDYWKSCSACFKQNNVDVNVITDFFKKESEQAKEVGEKFLIYKQCLIHLEENGTTKNKPLQDSVYFKMWKYRIQQQIQENESPETVQPLNEILSSVQSETTSIKPAEKSELLHFGKMPSILAETSDLDKKEKAALDLLISELLTNGHVAESCRVASVFLHYSQDLAIILTCIRLSIGSITIDMIDPALKKLLAQFTPRKSISNLLSMSSSSMSLSNVSSVWSELPIEKERVIETMDRFLGYCNKGQQCCLRIITAFKVSCILDIPYQNIVMDNEFDTLRDLLKTNFPARFILAKDFLATSSLSNNEVAGFLADSILKSLNYEESSLEGVATATQGRRSGFKSTGGEQYIKLCQDPSLLGDCLLQAANNDTGEITRSSLTLQTELLILAHECHTLACNMEGISHVLRDARKITESLCKAEEFSLMIRLLTGVGRFSEMTYIFDALKLHHQFEMLLKKGIEKEDKLKIAILDYLTRFHPNDNDTYTMVALNFIMYREIAQMLEERGKQCLKSLQNKAIDNIKEIQDILKESAQYYADAAERYVKDNCVRHAQQCIRQARLVALQIQLLPTGVIVINLSAEQLSEFIEHHPKFLDTLIVSESYNKRCDWSTAICHNVIINGDFRYLQDLKSHVQFQPIIIQDAVERYQQTSKMMTDQCLVNIKKLLTYCKDIKIQYRLASELGFKDLINQMLKGDSGSYLQDIIALS